jgi:hypothetical protein
MTSEDTRAVRAMLAAVALTLAGCGGDGGPEWNPDTGGSRVGGLVEEFRAYAEDVDEAWERSPVLLAGEFLRLDRREATRVRVTAESPGEATAEAGVTVVLEGLLDDSVAAERFMLALRRGGDVWRLEAADWAQRCHPGRGHEAFSAEPCL